MMNNLWFSWPQSKNVKTLMTTRSDGASKPPFAANNLATHVGDKLANVLDNRCVLRSKLHLLHEPHWLQQVHSNQCVVIEQDTNRDADASITSTPQQVLAIMTADCLPIMLCNHHGTEIAAIHAGWKGLFNGVIENTLLKLCSLPQNVSAWIGPGICKTCFVIKNDIINAYPLQYRLYATYFKKDPDAELWYVDLPGIAEKILRQYQINQIYQSNICTFEQPNNFYSYRRDGDTGRMATLIWMEYA